MTLNYKELVPTHSSTTLNCRNTQHPCTTLNCPPYCLTKQYNSSCDHRPRDDTKNGAYGTTNSGTFLNCSELDLSSSTDSLQTHDSLITPESPRTYLPSPYDSLVEGTSITQIPDSADKCTRDSLIGYGAHGVGVSGTDCPLTLTWGVSLYETATLYPTYKIS